MRQSINPLTPAQVYRYAVQASQPHLRLRGVKKLTAQTILTILFAAAARISSLSDTCRRLRDIPDEHAVADALYATLPEYNILRRRVQAALRGHLPKALRRRPQIAALDLTLLPYYGADAKTDPNVVRSKAKRGTCSFFGCGTAYVVHKGWRYTVALTAMTRGMTMVDLAREPLKQLRAAGIKVRFLVLDREFYSVAVIRHLQAARTPFLMPVVCHGRSAAHPLGPSGSNVFKQCKKSGWSRYTLTDATRRDATRRDATRRDEAQGHGADLREMPEPSGRARQTGPRGLDLCLLGAAPEAVRLGQGDLSKALRDRDQLSSDEPVPDSHDLEAFRGAVLVCGDRAVVAEPVGLAASRRALPPASRCCRTPSGAPAAEDDVALALRSGRRDVWACEHNLDRKAVATICYNVGLRRP
jgi:hypothetical protein